jgi:hypothetical protein
MILELLFAPGLRNIKKNMDISEEHKIQIWQTMNANYIIVFTDYDQIKKIINP